MQIILCLIYLGLFCWAFSGWFLTTTGVSVWHLNRCVRERKLAVYPMARLLLAYVPGLLLGPFALFFFWWLSEKENWLDHQLLVREYRLLQLRTVAKILHNMDRSYNTLV